MKRLLYYVVFVYSSKLINCSELKVDYTNLILDIRNVFGPSSIIFPYVIDLDNISDMKIFFEPMLELTKRKIPISIVALKGKKQLSNRTDFINMEQEIRETTRSMSIILFTSKSDIEKLNNISEQIIFDVSINVILFMSNDLPSGEFCIEFSRNKFKFNFFATVLIKCYGDTMIRKWHQFNANGIEFDNWGIWKPNTRLIKITKINSSVYTRRANLDGKVLKIATVEVTIKRNFNHDFIQASPLTQSKDGKPVGYLIEIMQILEKVMNFKTNYTKEEKEYGSWSKSRKVWSGAMNLIVKGEVDLIVSDLSITPQRLLSADFTTPLFLQKGVLYIRKPSNRMTISWGGHFQPFSWETWITIGFLIITTPIIVAVMTSMNLKTSYFSFSRLILECYFNVWRIYSQQGLDEVPTIPSLKLAYFSISVCSFILMSVYSAVLISYVAVPITSILPFSDLNGFVKDGSYKMVVQKDGSSYDMFRNANHSICKEMHKLMIPNRSLPLTVEDAFKMVCYHKIAYYNSQMLDEIINKSISCQVVKIPTGHFDSAGMVLRKRSPYTTAMNYHLSQLRDNGILSRLKTKYFLTASRSEKTNFDSIGIKGIAMLLVIFSGGIVLSVTLLFVEKCIAKL